MRNAKAEERRKPDATTTAVADRLQSSTRYLEHMTLLEGPDCLTIKPIKNGPSCRCYTKWSSRKKLQFVIALVL
jgi:hypothetical protein